MATNKWCAERRACKLSSCGKEFKPDTRQQLYCSRICLKRQYKSKCTWRIERKCALSTCSKTFIPAQYRQVFCTKACQKKSIAANFKERECGVMHCKTIFKPHHRYHIYCSEKCLRYARNPANTAAALARQKLNRKGAYITRDTDEQFRQKLQLTNPLKCSQTVCVPDCRIRGMENLGCKVSLFIC